MRTLTATLTAAQKSPSALPHPKVEISDRRGGIKRLSWTRLYTGSEVDNFHAAAMPGDGSLVRLRVDASNNLYRQRVASPGEGSDYATWTSWGVTSYAVALAAYGSTVFAFRVGLDGHLYRCESSDYGVSWGSWIDMGDIGGTSGTRLGACCKSATAAIILYSQSSALYRRRLSGGSWEAAAAWSNSVASITGVAVCYQGDWNIIVCGTETTTSNPHVWTCVLGDGYSASPGSWSSLQELTRAASGSNVSFGFPTVGFPDVFRAFFVEAYSGSESYSRPCWTHAPTTADYINNLWREPVPFNLASTYGLALCSGTTYVWLTRPDGVWRATLTPASVELTSDVSLLITDIKESSGSISLSLRNDDGRFNTLGSGTYEAIKLGAEVRFSPGYKTTAGAEVSSGLAFWITAFDYISRPATATFCVHASDAWSLLEAWKPRRQYTWASGSKNIFQLLSWVAARAGLELSALTNSSALVNQYPAFTIHPGDSGKTVVSRLLAMVPDVIFARGHYLYIRNPQSSDSSLYSYGSGTTPHRVYEGRFIQRVKETNRVQVFGTSVFTEDWDWDELSLVHDLLSQAKDINLTTTTKAHERGAAELRDASIHSLEGYLIVPLNCGQEVYDVIDITDPLPALVASKRRVLSLSHVFNPAKGQYALKIGLGLP